MGAGGDRPQRRTAEHVLLRVGSLTEAEEIREVRLPPGELSDREWPVRTREALGDHLEERGWIECLVGPNLHVLGNGTVGHAARLQHAGSLPPT